MSAAIVCERLCKAFGPILAVGDVSLEVLAGEVFGLLGPNGAGKTTTIRVLVTLLRPDSGRAEVFGHDVGHDIMEIRRLIGYVPQQLSADGGLTGWENMMLFARLYDLPRRERGELIERALELMGLQEARNRLARTYSGGMIRRLEMAQALVNRPRLLVLDEPTIGLDPVARSDVWERVLGLREDAGTTVLLTTHYMEEADQLCDRVALMHEGTIRALGTPAALKAAVGPTASLEDVFRHHSDTRPIDQGSLRDV